MLTHKGECLQQIEQILQKSLKVSYLYIFTCLSTRKGVANLHSVSEKHILKIYRITTVLKMNILSNLSRSELSIYMALCKSMTLLELKEYLVLIQMKINWNSKENIHEFTPAYVDTFIPDEIRMKLCPSTLIESSVDLMKVNIMSFEFGIPSVSLAWRCLPLTVNYISIS